MYARICLHAGSLFSFSMQYSFVGKWMHISEPGNDIRSFHDRVIGFMQCGAFLKVFNLLFFCPKLNVNVGLGT